MIPNNILLYLQFSVQISYHEKGFTQQQNITVAETHNETLERAQGILQKRARKDCQRHSFLFCHNFKNAH